MLLEIGCGGEGFLAELTLPRLALVVHALYVDPHVVTTHELLVTMRTGNIGNTSCRATNLKSIISSGSSDCLDFFRDVEDLEK